MAEKFPKDEFDDLPSSRKVGAHRAVERGWRSLRIVLGALLVTGLIVAACYGVMQITRSQSVFNDYSAAPSQSESPDSTEVGQSEEPTAEPSETAEPEAASPTPTATVNPYSLEVTVYNGQGRQAQSGLASRTGAQLTASGWKVGQVANAPSALSGRTNSVVYYSDAQYAEAAQKLSSELQLGDSPRLEPGFSTPLTLVLGTSFRAGN